MPRSDYWGNHQLNKETDMRALPFAVLAIFVAIKNGLIEGISTLEHQRPGILGKFRVADKT